MSTVPRFVCAMAVFLIAEGAHGQECLPQDTDAADARRREAAIEYVVAVNAAQTQRLKLEGKYAQLNELRDVPHAPVGFIPKLLMDRWSYMVSLKDYLDACGFALFSDERGVIYEAHPHTVTRTQSDEASDNTPGST